MDLSHAEVIPSLKKDQFFCKPTEALPLVLTFPLKRASTTFEWRSGAPKTHSLAIGECMPKLSENGAHGSFILEGKNIFGEKILLGDRSGGTGMGNSERKKSAEESFPG